MQRTPRFLWHAIGILTILLLCWSRPALAERQVAGAQVGLATTVTFTVDAAPGRVSVTSNIPKITIVPIRSSSELTILRRASISDRNMDASVSIGRVEYAIDPEKGRTSAFVDQDARWVGADRREALLPATGFATGETIFFHLYDAGLNHRPTVAEQVLISFSTDGGDQELIRLTANGPDSSDFYGYAQITDINTMRSGDGKLAVRRNGKIEARYADAFDRSDVRVAAAIVDPVLRVFDALEGGAVDGAVVRILSDESGREAPVFHLDGSTKGTRLAISGAGKNAVSGEVSIPYLMPGRYRLVVQPPSNYVFPSTTPDPVVAPPTGGTAYRLPPGSFGAPFEIVRGGPPILDIPLDPRRSLFLRQSIAPASAAPGDTVMLTLELRNDHDETANVIKIANMLPPGLRPVEPKAFDAGTGRLVRKIARLDPGESVVFTIAARVGVDASPGEHEAVATATAMQGYRSNPARAVMTVTDPFDRDASRILGTVMAGACGTPGTPASVRFVTETGILIESDREGRFHLDGLKPGRHVLRLDETSLPEGMVAIACPGDLWPGDRPAMRLIETRAGLAQLVRFRLRDTRPAPIRPPAPTPDAETARASPAPNGEEASADSAPAFADLAAPAMPDRPKTDYTAEDLLAFDGLTLVYPAEGARLMRPLFEIGIAYPFGHTIDLRVNGVPVEDARYAGVIGNKDARVAMRRWKGIRAGKDSVILTVTMTDKEGDKVAQITRTFGKGIDPVLAAFPPPPSPTVEEKAIVPEPTPIPSRRPRSTDDLANLPARLAILHPAEGSGLSSGRFDLDVSLPFGMEIAVSVDGDPIDPSLSEKPLVNRRARLSVRRWRNIPTGSGREPVMISVIATARDGTRRTVERTLHRRVLGTAQPPPPIALTVAEDVRPGTLGELPPSLERRLQFVHPAEGASLADPSLRLGIAHPLGTRLRVTVNGIAPSNRSMLENEADPETGLVTKTWQGIDLPDGETVIEASTLDRDGAVIDTVTRRVHYVTEAVEAIYLPDESILLADGTTAPVIAVRLVDDAGRPLHAGRRVSAMLAPPYRSARAFERIEETSLSASRATRVTLIVGKNGIARLTLRPTIRSGEVDLRVRLKNRETRLRPWLSVSARPWIVVGLAEGTVGHATVSGNMEAAERIGAKGETFTDGRLAFYAKGAIRGEWLLTLAYNSNADYDTDDVDDRIDPNAYYTVYGDASLREEGAQSRYPLYVRLERGRFFALFGDYGTGLNRTRLGAYSRQMSGFKTVYEGDSISLVAFAAEADRQFRRREIEATLGIGPYALDPGIARNSETVLLVTRRRERLEEVVAETVLAPFLDYDIDYATGTLTLRLPPDPADTDFNPVFVVVDYERPVADEGTVTAGGRAAVRLWKDRAEIGATAVHEEGGAMDAVGDLIALDATIAVTDNLEVEAEIAASRTEDDGERRQGAAFRAEARYVAEGWSARAYVHQSEADFGVASQSVAQAGRRTVGAELQATIDGPARVDAHGVPRTGTIDFTVSATSDADLSTEARRNSVEVTAGRDVEINSRGRGYVSIGYRGEHDVQADGATGRTHRLIARAEAKLLDGRAHIGVERDQTINATGTTAPDATRLSLRTALTERIDGTLGVEVFDNGPDKANLIAGLSARPWKGGRADAGLIASRAVAGSGTSQRDRLNASLGVQQKIAITDALSATLQVARTQPLGGSASPVTQSLFSARNGASDEPTTSAAAGLGYAAHGWQASVRLDMVDAGETRTAALRGAITRDVSEALTLAAALDTRLFESVDNDDHDTHATFAAGYRSLDGRLAALQRFELSFGRDAGRSVLHSLTVSHTLNDRLTLSSVHALRYSHPDSDADAAITQFVGGDIYYRFRDNWQAGLHGDILANLDGSEALFAFGGSIGYAPRTGMLLSLGYNVTGFDSADFDDANHTRQGPYVRFSLAFDESDITGLATTLGSVVPIPPLERERPPPIPGSPASSLIR